MSHLHQFARRRDARRLIAALAAHPFDQGQSVCISQMLVVPCCQVIHTCACAYCNVQRIVTRLRRHCMARHQRNGKPFDLRRRRVHQRKVRQRNQAVTRGICIAQRGFVEHELLDHRLISRQAADPPFRSERLMRGYDQIPVRPGSQIANNTGFDVNLRPHLRMVAGSRVGRNCSCHPTRIVGSRCMARPRIGSNTRPFMCTRFNSSMCSCPVKPRSVGCTPAGELLPWLLPLWMRCAARRRRMPHARTARSGWHRWSPLPHFPGCPYVSTGCRCHRFGC